LAPLHELSDVDVVAVSVVSKGANRKRYFLKKLRRREPLLDLPKAARVAKAADWSAVYCVVAEPGALEDAGMHGDRSIPDRWASEEEIRKAAHRFMRNGGLVNLMHKSLEPYGTLVENAIALADFEVNGEVIRKGSWYVAFEPNEEAKAAIERGDFAGVSIQGTGTRTLVEKRKPFDEKKHPRKGGKFAPKGTQTVEGRQAITPKGKRKGKVTDEQRKARTIRTAANLLARLGYSGNMGEAIRSFQAEHKLPANGQLDPQTMAALRSKTRGRRERDRRRRRSRSGLAVGKPPKPQTRRSRKRAGLHKRSLAHSPEQNWIERLPKPMQTAFEHSWLHRVAVHLVDKGHPVGQAIAIGVNAAKKACATGDVNFPGVQQINAGSRAEACAAVALWESMKAAAHAQGGSVAKLAKGDGEESEESVEAVFADWLSRVATRSESE
jgi:hypothetical protein